MTIYHFVSASVFLNTVISFSKRVLSLQSTWIYVLWSDNCLVLNRRQFNSWVNDGLVYGYIYAPSVLDWLNIFPKAGIFIVYDVFIWIYFHHIVLNVEPASIARPTISILLRFVYIRVVEHEKQISHECSHAILNPNMPFSCLWKSFVNISLASQHRLSLWTSHISALDERDSSWCHVRCMVHAKWRDVWCDLNCSSI